MGSIKSPRDVSSTLLCVFGLPQMTIQDLFEVEAGSGEKVEEFVVLHQEPSPSEAISPRVARPNIQALSSISLDAPPPGEEQGGRGGLRTPGTSWGRRRRSKTIPRR